MEEKHVGPERYGRLEENHSYPKDANVFFMATISLKDNAGPNKIRKSQVEGTDFLFLIGHS